MCPRFVVRTHYMQYVEKKKQIIVYVHLYAIKSLQNEVILNIISTAISFFDSLKHFAFLINKSIHCSHHNIHLLWLIVPKCITSITLQTSSVECFSSGGRC